jgi:uncharacterized small protein (DUF1192 family)
VFVKLATHLQFLIERSSTQLAGTKVQKLEKGLKYAKDEVARLKADLKEARSMRSAAEDHVLSLKNQAAERNKEIESLLAKSEAAAKEDAETISKLKANLASAESSAIQKYRSSSEFETAKLEFASAWVFDTVSQCRRLVKENLGAKDLGFLAPIDIARAVEARRKLGAEVEISSGDSSEDGEDEAEVTEVPSSAIPIAAEVPVASPSPAVEGNSPAT